MGGIAGQVEPLMMHRVDDADTQVKHIALNERTLRELRFTLGVQPLPQFRPDPIVPATHRSCRRGPPEA
jgi:hypothetical protein